jgi:hypothetical protein
LFGCHIIIIIIILIFGFSKGEGGEERKGEEVPNDPQEVGV